MLRKAVDRIHDAVKELAPPLVARRLPFALEWRK
jgi:hypothetical protein